MKHHLTPCPVLKGHPWGPWRRGSAAARTFQGQRLASGVGPSPLSVAPPPHFSQQKQNQNRDSQKLHSQAVPLDGEADWLPTEEIWGTQVSWCSLPGLDTSHKFTQSSRPLLALSAGCLLRQRGLLQNAGQAGGPLGYYLSLLLFFERKEFQRSFKTFLQIAVAK